MEERVQNFWKEALRFEERAIPGEFWDILYENDPEDHHSRIAW
ncbi:hypothetical protein [Methanofollis formosanus]|nr:hypothetical protein [Methanofollis formosanus]